MPLAMLEGYSPAQTHPLLLSPFGGSSPLALKTISPAAYESMPLLNMVKYFMGIISEREELKLTTKGFLPVKVVG